MLLKQTEQPTVDGFRHSVIEANVLARSSRSSRAKLLTELRGRYILNESSPIFASFLKEWKTADCEHAHSLLVFVLLALNDRTVMVTSCEWLFSHLQQPGSELRIGDLDAFLLSMARTTHPEIDLWSNETRLRVEQHYLASIRDFGLATGATKKISVKPALYAAPVRLLIQALFIAGANSSAIVRHEAFKILGIAPNEVIDMLSELHRQGSLHFRMQADIVELSL
jgi:hypothetical protein